jgi:hypothetical protein
VQPGDRVIGQQRISSTQEIGMIENAGARMCTLLFLASDRPVRIIPWDPANPSFHVRELTDREQAIRQRVSRPYVYYVGSHELCGCGFRYSLPLEELWREVEEEAAARQSVQRLADYVSDLRTGEAIDLYACATEDLKEAEPMPTARRTISRSSIGGDAFEPCARANC